MKSVTTICCALLFALVSSSGPIIEEGCTPAHGALCTYITGVSHVAQGEWEACPNNINLCKGNKRFKRVADQYTMVRKNSPDTILGYCHDNVDGEINSIFECSDNFYEGNRDAPYGDFDFCCHMQRRRRLTTGASCWPASDPRVISFIDGIVFYMTFGQQIFFGEFWADEDSGCSGGRPIYKTRMSEFPNQYTIQYANNRWELTRSGSTSMAICTEYDLRNCGDWYSGGWWIYVFGIYANERLTCQYIEDTRDIMIHSDWLSRAGKFNGLPLPMSIQYEDRCFFTRPAWAGTTEDAYIAAGQTMPAHTPVLIFYISYENQGSNQRWLLTYDYINYNRPVYKCDGDPLTDLKECTTSSDWYWLWDYLLGDYELDISQPQTAMTLEVVSTGPFVDRTTPFAVPVSPVSKPWGSSINLLVASCTFLNFATFAAHCVYKRQSQPAKAIDASAL